MSEPTSAGADSRKKDSSDIHDSLLCAIEWISEHHGLIFSADVALHGAALVDGKMTIAQLELAFKNVGLSARFIQKSPADVPLIVCPFLIFFAGGDVGIVTGRQGKRGKFNVVLADS